MRLYSFMGLLVFLWSLISSPSWGAEKQAMAARPDIEPQATKILKQMCDYLVSLKQFSFQADDTEDVSLTSGQRIQYGKSVTVYVSRPNRVRADFVGDKEDGQFIYDGKTITLLDRGKNFYTSIDAPPEINAALDYAIQAFNLRAPLADLINSKGYEYLTDEVISGHYEGLHRVQGIPCHHLAFRQKDVDWQIWIENSRTPLPRKVIITDHQAQALQFTALLSKWHTSPQLEDSLFTFVAPAKAEKIGILPAAGAPPPQKEPEGQAGGRGHAK
jgi:hypothetical protein